MKKQVLITVLLSVMLGASASGYFLYVRPHSQARSNARTDVLGSEAESPESTQSTATTQGNTALSGSLQTQVLSQNTGQTTSNNASAPNSPSPSTSTGSANSEKATLNPAEFSVYEKYKTSQTALFAEITAGTGAEATTGKKVSVNYRGWLTNGSMFDQNTDTAKPFSFTLGAGNVIAGWEQTIAGMKVGSERLLIIPPTAGYGATAQGPIPASSVLIFDVKLLKIE